MTLSLIVITLLLTIATTLGHVELTAAQAARTALGRSARGTAVRRTGFVHRLAGERATARLRW